MHIISSTAQNNGKKEKFQMMNEKIYKTMSSAGAAGLVLGILTLVTGIVTGILMIINGARLLKEKSDILI